MRDEIGDDVMNAAMSALRALFPDHAIVLCVIHAEKPGLRIVYNCGEHVATEMVKQASRTVSVMPHGPLPRAVLQ